jgi:hypothetical protein
MRYWQTVYSAGNCDKLSKILARNSFALQRMAAAVEAMERLSTLSPRVGSVILRRN